MPTIKHAKLPPEASKLTKYITILIFGGILVLSVSLVRGINKARLASQTIERAQKDNDKLQQEITKLRDDLKNTQSEEFIERQLRDGLGMAQKGEVIIVMPDEEYVRSLAPKMETEEIEAEKPNWQKWVEVFL